jgi:tRNA modification GTPase
MKQQTIFALATPPGRSGVAVVRVSGPQAWASFAALRGKRAGQEIAPRQAGLFKLSHPVSRETIDQALVIAFAAPASFTGEDVVEYHLHGSPAVVQSMLSALQVIAGHRMAEPGEFTRRAFENGKIDLTAAEAIADLIDAQTQAQKIQALAQMEGALSKLYHRWAAELTRALAHLEADIEFPDEDLPEGVNPQVLESVQAMIAEIAAHLDDNRRGERLRDGIQVAVIGAPNAGKSSLVNALAQRDVAIVSNLPGTTRDVIEVHLEIDGYPVILADTAGLRPEQLADSGQDAIESEGIRRALQRAASADIRILLFDGTLESPDPHTLGLIDEGALIVVNKSDQTRRLQGLEGAINVSAETGKGLMELINALSQRVEGLIGRQETPSLTRARHRAALEACTESLRRSCKAPLPELMAEDIRLAVRDLGRITGRVDVEDLLDVIFRDFCIGK